MLNFGFNAEKTLARQLAEHIQKTLPARMMDPKKGMLSANRITRTLEQCYSMAREVHLQHKISYFGRVLLAGNLRWALQEKGYQESFVDVAVEGLIVELSKKN